MSKQIERYRPDAGYDHPWYDRAPLPERPPIRWPGDARVAMMAIVYLEYWELDPPPGSVADPRMGGALGSYFPDYMSYTRREFGNRVGIFRIFDILDRHGIKPTVAAGAEAVRRYPYIVDLCRERGYGVVAHGTHATRMISSRMSEAEERAHIAEAVEAVERAFGRRPRGWAGQDCGESERTPRLLAEAGLDYVLDWPNDDAPYRMNVGRPFLSLPNQTEWDDAQLFIARKVDAWHYPQIVADAFEQLHREGGRLFGIGLHPWVFGQAHRIGHLDDALKRIGAFQNVWRADSDAIADCALAQ